MYALLEPTLLTAQAPYLQAHLSIPFIFYILLYDRSSSQVLGCPISTYVLYCIYLATVDAKVGRVCLG
jgi:hypothetical protein